MPTIPFPVPEFGPHILRPVTQQIAESVLLSLGVRQHFRDALYVRSEGEPLINPTAADGSVVQSHTRCDVKVAENFNYAAGLRWDNASFDNTQAHGSTRWISNQVLPMFADAPAGVYVTEQFVPFGLSLEFSLRFKEREHAHRAISAVTSRSAGQGVFTPHDIAYSYPLSMDLAAALLCVWKLRTGWKDGSFIEYLKAHTSQDLDLLVRKAEIGHTPTDRVIERELVIQRQQLKCVGLLEYTQTTPDVLMQDQIADRHVVNFTYHVQFQRPETLTMVFPVVVDNQLIPPALIATTPTHAIRALQGVMHNRAFNAWQNRPARRPPIARLPFYDDFAPTPAPATQCSFLPLLIAAFTLDAGGQTTISLADDLDAYQLHPTLKRILALHGDEVFGTSAIFNLTVYSNDLPICPSRLSFSQDLTLTVQATDTAKRYHVVLSEMTQGRYLNPKWWEVIIRERAFFPITVIRHLDQLVRSGYVRVVPSHDLLDLITRCLRAGKLDQHLATLIAAGHAGAEIYQYTLTASQFAAYICTTRSAKCPNRYLYHELVDIGITAGCIDPNQVPAPIFDGPFPFTPGVTYGHNFPLRILEFILTPTRRGGADQHG